MRLKGREDLARKPSAKQQSDKADQVERQGRWRKKVAVTVFASESLYLFFAKFPTEKLGMTLGGEFAVVTIFPFW